MQSWYLKFEKGISIVTSMDLFSDIKVFPYRTDLNDQSGIRDVKLGHAMTAYRQLMHLPYTMSGKWSKKALIVSSL